MKTITRIKAQRRYKDRFNIYLDDEYSFWLSKHTAATLSVGQEIDEESLADLVTGDLYEKAYLKALNFVSYRPRTMWEVRKRLIQYGYEVGLIQKVLDKLLMNGVLNDEDFVKQWIETRNYSHPRSRRFLIMELKKKGVTEELIQRTTQKEQFEEDEITAYRAGAKYSWRLRNLDWKTFRQRLGMYLVRRGYQYEVVDSVVKTLWLETQRTDDF